MKLLSALALLVGIGCGGNASLSIQLYTPAAPDEDPFSGVALMRLQVSAPGLDLPPQEFGVGLGTARLQGLPLSRFVTVVVEGRDVAGTVLSRGRSSPVDLVAGANVRLPVFFARVQRFAINVGVLSGQPSGLRESRAGHTVTVLHDGRLLIVGGAVLNAQGAIASQPFQDSEIYDPATGVSILGPATRFARVFHTATVLKDGRVLVAGGLSFISGNLSPLATAEIYEPSSRSFRLLNPLREARGRVSHTSTLLPDGSVLLAGGWGQNTQNVREVVASAERFVPAQDTFVDAGSLNEGRASHTATLLLSGKVLVTGGRTDAAGSVRSTELFDLSAATPFVTGPELPADGRAGHSATRLGSGQVLLSGGCTRPAALAAGADAVSGSGCHAAGSGALARVELYDPGAGTTGGIGAGSTLGVARAGHAAVLLPGEDAVLIAGGFVSDGSATGSVEIVRQQGSQLQVSAIGSLRSSRAFQAATRLHSGVVWVSGGSGRALGGTFSVQSSIELLVP